MSLLPQDTNLGKLEILEVYEYYDVPCLFACQNKSGQIFLASWAKQNREFGTWLYVPMSAGRFAGLRSGEIDLRDAYVNSEDGFVYEVTIPCDDSGDRAVTISCNHLNENWLPMSGEFLDLGEAEVPVSDRVYDQGAIAF